MNRHNLERPIITPREMVRGERYLVQAIRLNKDAKAVADIKLVKDGKINTIYLPARYNRDTNFIKLLPLTLRFDELAVIYLGELVYEGTHLSPSSKLQFVANPTTAPEIFEMVSEESPRKKRCNILDAGASTSTEKPTKRRRIAEPVVSDDSSNDAFPVDSQ